MFKKKYYFNPDTLRFERVSYTSKVKIFEFSFIFTLLILFAIFLRTEFDKHAESPKIHKLIEKNKHLKISYNLLNEQINKAENLLADIQKRDDHVYHSILNIPPLPASIREAGVGGSENISDQLMNRSTAFVVSIAIQLEKLANRVKIQSSSLENIASLTLHQIKMISCRPSIHPLSPANKFWLSSGFGIRLDPFTQIRRWHQGIDLAGDIGTEIYATGDGKVVESVSGKYGYGKEIVINHGYGYKTRYAHLHKILVKPGEVVKRGQLIGLLGNTGRSTGPHLHYEVLFQGKPQNPFYYFYENLSREEYSKIITLARK